MVLTKEYRIVMPLTLDEYARGQLYTTAVFSKSETTGGEGIEIVKNEPYRDHPQMGNGQYTYKIYHLSSKVPSWVRMIAPNGSLELHEEAWNGFPKIKTVLTNKYMGEKFRIVLESFHSDGKTVLENAVNLPADVLKKREIVNIDIAKDKVEPKDYVAEQDPTKVRSEKAGRGPLVGNWKETANPVMTVYKVFTAEFRVMGLQDRVESFIHKANHNLILLFHRKLFCFLDQYYDMTIEDIRAYEEKTKQEMLANLASARSDKEKADAKGKKGSKQLEAPTHPQTAPPALTTAAPASTPAATPAPAPAPAAAAAEASAPAPAAAAPAPQEAAAAPSAPAEPAASAVVVETAAEPATPADGELSPEIIAAAAAEAAKETDEAEKPADGADAPAAEAST